MVDGQLLLLLLLLARCPGPRWPSVGLSAGAGQLIDMCGGGCEDKVQPAQPAQPAAVHTRNEDYYQKFP